MAADIQRRAPEMVEFCYPDEHSKADPVGWEGWSMVDPSSAAGAADGLGAARSGVLNDVFHGSAKDEPPPKGSVEEAILRAREEGRAAGRAEGRLEGESAGLTQGRAEERETDAAIRAREQAERARTASDLVNGFLREQERYLHLIEHEVVQLALAVAARILRREVRMDPLLLTSAVRVALGQLSESTRVVLQVPEADLSLWTEAMRLVPNLALRPVVLAGEGMKLGECLIQTEMGSVDLGLKAQLAEIERGFFDRSGARTASSTASTSSTQAELVERVEPLNARFEPYRSTPDPLVNLPSPGEQWTSEPEEAAFSGSSGPQTPNSRPANSQPGQRRLKPEEEPLEGQYEGQYLEEPSPLRPNESTRLERISGEMRVGPITEVR